MSEPVAGARVGRRVAKARLAFDVHDGLRKSIFLQQNAVPKTPATEARHAQKVRVTFRHPFNAGKPNECVSGKIWWRVFLSIAIRSILMKTYLLLTCTVYLLILSACGGNNTDSNVDAPGAEKSGKSQVLDAGADLIQSAGPLKKMNAYLDGFHFYNGNIDAQMEAHHYVSQLNEDVYQAVIFDGNGEDAKLMGVEYIITERLFKTLDEEEKKLWHSHHYEVKSGTLIAPGLPDVAERELMEKLVSTYGKTIHTWHTDQEFQLPVGSPMIMMGFTRDGQLDPELLRDRDARFDVSTPEKKKQREDIPMPAVDPLANAWEKEEIRQFIITDKTDSAHRRH